MNIRNINEYCSNGDLEKLTALDITHLMENLERSTGLYGYTPIHSAATGNQRCVIEYLLGLDCKESYVNIRASSNYTPLHLAVSFGYTDCVECLIGYNADIDARDSFGKTPLDIANDSKSKRIVNLLGKEKLKRTISLYLETQNEETEKRNEVHTKIRMLLDTFKNNDKFERDKTYKECIQQLLDKFMNLPNPKVTNAIDILGLLIYLNHTPYSDQIIFCCENRKLHYLGWYQILIRAIANDLGEIIRCLLFMEQIPDRHASTFKDLFQINSISDVNEVIEQTKTERENVKISLKFPIRLANQQNSQYLERYLEWMMAEHRVSQEVVNWSSLKISKIPDKLFSVQTIQKTKKLIVSHNLLRVVPKPILNLRFVESLNLSYNNLTNAVPCQVLALESLKCLDLSHNEIPGFTQNKNGGHLICQSLGKLLLNNNKFRDINNDIFISRLSFIDLSKNKLNGIPVFLAKCTQLTELDITGNPSLTKLPSFLGDLTNLDKIRLDLKQFPSLSVNNSHNIDEKATTIEIKECLRGARPIHATKLFCIGEGDEIRMRFLRDFLRITPESRVNISCTNNEDALQLIDGENPRITEPGTSLKIWNVRNNNTEVMSKIIKKLAQVRALIFIVIDFEQGICKSVEKWIKELIKMYPPNRKEFDWIDCVSIIAYNAIACKNSDMIKISDQIFKQYTDGQIGDIRKRIVSGKFRKLCSYKDSFSYLTVEEDHISSEYTTIFKCFMGNTVKQKREQKSDKIISIDQFIYIFKDTPALDLIKGLRQTHRIEDFLDMFDRLGLIEYIKELRETPIVLDLCGFYNTLAGIVLDEKQLYIKSGLLVLPHFISHVKEHRYPVKLKYNEDYMLLLRKWNLVLMVSQSLYIIPSRLPKLTKKIDIEQFFSPKASEKMNDKNGFIHRIFQIAHMSDQFCNKLIVDILYEMRLLQVTINNNPKLEEYFLNNTDSSTSLSPHNCEDITRAMSPRDMEFTSDDKSRSLSIWKDNLVFKDEKNGIKILLRLYFVSEKDKGIEIAFARDSNKNGESFLFQVKTILYTQQDCHRNIKELIAVPCKSPNDETNPFIIDSFYKLNPIFEAIGNNSLNIMCEVREGWISEETLTMFAPDLFPEKNFGGRTFTELPYNPKGKRLGNGGSSTVFRGDFWGKKIAVKEFRHNNGESRLRVYHEMFTEAKILLEYRHSCLIDVIGVSSSSLPRCFMVMTFAPLGDLTFFLKNTTLNPRILYLRIAQQMAAGVNYLHTHIKDVPLIHHDLKPENILVFSNQVLSCINVKIADLNFSKKRVNKDGTQGYRAPEIISQNTMVSHDYKIDVYSYAIVLLYLITRRNPYREMGTADSLYTLKGMRPELNWQQSFEMGIVSLLPVIQACWSQDPKNRPEMGSVLSALSSPSLQFLYSNRSLPQNSSYNPIESCTVHFRDKQEILCYAFSTTFQGRDLYTRICYYDVKDNKMTDRQYDDFYKNKSLLQMCSYKNKVILTLRDEGASIKCYLILFKFVGHELIQVKKIDLDEEIFQVKTMCVDENNIYLALDRSIYVYRLDTLDPGGIIEGLIDHPIQCIYSLGNELWISTEPSLKEKPSLSMRVLCKDTFKIHRIEQENDTWVFIGQIDTTYQDPNDTHQTEVQVWCLDACNPHIYIFDSIEKERIGLLKLPDFLPKERNFSQQGLNTYNYKNTKMCASLNTMWVSTQFGCILVFSIGPKNPELLTTLDVFQGSIVFLSHLQLLSGSFVACCGQDFVHPFYHATELQFYDILSLHSKEGNFTRREEMSELTAARSNTPSESTHYEKPRKHDIVLWEAYDAEVYQLVEKTKKSEFWESKEAHTSPLPEEMLEILNQSVQEDYFMSGGYSSHKKTVTM